MNNLLIFFALPIAVIIISIALQKIFKCPFLVAAIIFAIFLVVTFVIDNLEFLVATIAYTIFAFVTAVITNVISRVLREIENRGRRTECGCSNDNVDDNMNLLTISSSGCNGIENELLTINSNCSRGNSGSVEGASNCTCSTSNGSVAVRANVFPNSNNNGRTGSFCGCFRRR